MRMTFKHGRLEGYGFSGKIATGRVRDRLGKA